MTLLLQIVFVTTIAIVCSRDLRRFYPSRMIVHNDYNSKVLDEENRSSNNLMVVKPIKENSENEPHSMNRSIYKTHHDQPMGKLRRFEEQAHHKPSFKICKLIYLPYIIYPGMVYSLPFYCDILISFFCPDMKC